MENSLKDKVNPDIYRAMKKGTDEDILDLSLRYQLLSKKTAFICRI
jgi:hypothetical protein